MSLGSAPVKSSQGEEITHTVTAVGGAAAVTKEHGPGVTVARTGTGAYTITWGESQGTWRGQTYSLSATTVADLAGHSVIFAPYNATTRVLAFTVFNATPVAHDLAALEHVTVKVMFSATSVNGA